MIASADERMKQLEIQWVEHKAPMVNQLEELRQKAKTRQVSYTHQDHMCFCGQGVQVVAVECM